MLGQVVDDQIDELDLVRAESLPIEKPRERFLCGSTIDTDERSHEETEPMRLFRGPADVVGSTNAALDEDALQFGQVGYGERPVHPKLVDGDMIKMRSQERLRLRPELGVVRPLGEAR